MAYATATDVAAYLGRSLTPEQETQATFYVEAATAWIEQYTGKKWDEDSPVTETHTVIGNVIYLKNVPVVEITSLSSRGYYPGAQSVNLTIDENYSLVDAEKGLVVFDNYVEYNNVPFRSGYSGYLVTVTYTHTAQLPANIKLATVMLAAYKMNSTLNPAQSRIKSMNDNRAVNVTFKDDVIPKDIVQMLPPKPIYIV